MAPEITYQKGFGNQFQSEAIPNTLPLNQNSPQKLPFGLYPEQINGSAFTEPRHSNLRSWVYKLLPSAKQPMFIPAKNENFNPKLLQTLSTPNRMRWNEIPKANRRNTNFILGINMLLANGHPKEKRGIAIYTYATNTSMSNQYFYCADGDWLIVPYIGDILFITEFGKLLVGPGEFIVIPRGIKFKTELQTNDARGFIAENFGQPFKLPDLGAIGCNGLANARNFLYPTAFFEQNVDKSQLLVKFHHSLWQTTLDHSPLNVVAWHGNLAPYKYSLKNFNTLNSVSFDHPDPSIFTVLTSPSSYPGMANMDFVIFPERWMVAEHTFRPPYFHRNTMSEFMGLIYGNYDAKGKSFVPGGSSCHNCMTAHGPDVESYIKAINEDLKPVRQENVLAFMFESAWEYQPTQYALNSETLDKNYDSCWEKFKNNAELK